VVPHPFWGYVPLRGGVFLSDSIEHHLNTNDHTEGQSICQAKKKPLERGLKAFALGGDKMSKRIIALTPTTG
jgi:hypothetical protein